VIKALTIWAILTYYAFPGLRRIQLKPLSVWRKRLLNPRSLGTDSIKYFFSFFRMLLCNFLHEKIGPGSPERAPQHQNAARGKKAAAAKLLWCYVLLPTLKLPTLELPTPMLPNIKLSTCQIVDPSNCRPNKLPTCKIVDVMKCRTFRAVLF
jgi:hypothetical protein